MIGIFQKGILKTVPNIEEFLGYKIVFNPKKPDGLVAIAGWGYKQTSKKAIQKSKEWGLPYWAFEEGFIRDFEGFPSPVSLVVDPVGIYYDSTKPSLLENLLNSYEFKQEDLLWGKEIREWIVRNKISKYNNYVELNEPCLVNSDRCLLDKEKVLVIDQTLDDMSVVLGAADKDTFKEMLQSALDENPQAIVFVKIHPRVYLGEKKGYLEKVKENNRIKILWKNYNPFDILRYMDRVYTVSSQMGFEALLLEKEVHCFGLPFYAGWGLTKDRKKCERRKRVLNIEEMVFVVYNEYMKFRIGFGNFLLRNN